MKIIKENIHYILIFCASIIALILRYFINSDFERELNFFYNDLIVDAGYYNTQAERILSNGILNEKEVFWQAPLYQYFLAFIYRIFGTDISYVRLSQSLLSIINILLIFYCGKIYFNKRIGIVCAFIYAIYPIFIFFDLHLECATILVTLYLSFSIFLYHGLTNNRIIFLYLFTFILGISSLAHGIALGILFLIMLVFLLGKVNYFKSFFPYNVKIKHIIGVFIVGLIPILPSLIHNYSIDKSFIPVSANSGLNLYIGNNLNIEPPVPPGIEYSAILSEVPNYFSADYGRRNSYFIKKTIDQFIDKPIEHVLNYFYKIITFFSPTEIASNYEIVPDKQYSNLFSFLFIQINSIHLTWGLICLFSIIGMISYVVINKKINLLIIIIASHILLTAVFFVVTRYRIPILPFLIMFSIYGFITVFNIILKNSIINLKYKILFLLFTISFILFVILDTHNEKDYFSSDTLRNHSSQLMINKKIYHAKYLINEALLINPENVTAIRDLGILYLLEKDYNNAIKTLEDILVQYPYDRYANYYLIKCYLALGNHESAKKHFDQYTSRYKGDKLFKGIL